MSDDTEPTDGLHREGVDDELTDREFRLAAAHSWLNGFACVRPTDEFLIEVGRSVVESLKYSDLRTRRISAEHEGSKACIIWFNMS